MITLFAQGKEDEQQVQGTLTAGTRFIPINNPGEYFQMGDEVFVGKPDNAYVEYPGRVVSVDVSGIFVQFALKENYPAESTVWKPASTIPLCGGKVTRVHKRVDTGLKIQRSLGGVLYTTRVRDPFRVVHLTLPTVSQLTYLMLENWIVVQLDYGIKRFTFVDQQRNVQIVRLLNPELEYEEYQPGMANLDLDLAVYEESGYE